MNEDERARSFAALASLHLDAAYNLARWLTRSPTDAEDVVQEAFLRALRFYDGFRGGDGRAWLLTIVRNTFYTWKARERAGRTVEYEEEAAGLQLMETETEPALHNADPEALWLRAADRERVERALLALPAEPREILVLRELEELSYKEIAAIIDVPLGTVMSRLSRARALLRAQLEVLSER